MLRFCLRNVDICWCELYPIQYTNPVKLAIHDSKFGQSSRESFDNNIQKISIIRFTNVKTTEQSLVTLSMGTTQRYKVWYHYIQFIATIKNISIFHNFFFYNSVQMSTLFVSKWPTGRIIEHMFRLIPVCKDVIETLFVSMVRTILRRYLMCFLLKTICWKFCVLY